jgi:hypothetical protein
MDLGAAEVRSPTASIVFGREGSYLCYGEQLDHRYNEHLGHEGLETCVRLTLQRVASPVCLSKVSPGATSFEVDNPNNDLETERRRNRYKKWYAW